MGEQQDKKVISPPKTWAEIFICYFIDYIH